MSKLDINEDARPALPNNQTYMPLRINDMQSILGLESDIAGIIIVGLAIGHISHQLFLVLSCAFLIAYAVNWVKENYPKGRLKHLLWWVGIINYEKTRSFPCAFQRTFYR